MKRLTIFLGITLCLFLCYDFTLSQQPLIKPIFVKISDLKDVATTTPTDNYVLTYDSSTALWGPEATGAGGGTVDTSGTPVDNDFAKFTDADTIEGRSYSETLSDIGAAASSHAMSTHSDEDTYNISTPGSATVGSVITPLIGATVYYCSPYATFIAAVTDIGATEATLVITEAENVADDDTVPATLTLKFERGGSLSIDNTKTVTINGPVQAGQHQIFEGSGGVVDFDTNNLQSQVIPQWWGAVADGSTDVDAHFLLALDAVEDNDLILYVPAGQYNVAGLTDTPGGRFTIVGEDRDRTVLLAGVAFTINDDGFTVRDITFKSWTGTTGVFKFSPVGALSGFNLIRVAFDSCHTGISTASGTTQVIDEFHVEDCIFKTMQGHAISLPHAVTYSKFINNYFDTIGDASSGGAYGIGIGQNGTITTSIHNTIRGNVMKTINAQSGSECHGIIAYGKYLVIDGNTVYNIVAAAANADREAIYTKAQYSTISNNTIMNGGLGDGCIAAKGGVNNVDNVINGNNISGANSAVGIYVNSGGNVISNNRINVSDDTNGRTGIALFGSATSYKFTVSGNRVIAQRDGLHATDLRDTIITGNYLETEEAGYHPIELAASALSYRAEGFNFSNNICVGEEDSCNLSTIKDAVIANNVFESDDDRAHMGGCINTIIIGNTFWDGLGGGTRVDEILRATCTSGYLIIKDNFFTTLGNLGTKMIEIDGAGDITFEGNTLEMPAGSADTVLAGLQLLQDASRVSTIIRNNTFSSRIIYGIYWQGGAYGDVTISGNLFRSTNAINGLTAAATGDVLMIHDNNHEGSSTFFSGSDPNFTEEYIYNNQGNILGANGLTTPKWDITPGSLHTAVYEDSVADEAEFSCPTTTSGGWGMVSTADAGEYGTFWFTAAGAVTLGDVSANVVNTDTNGNLCIYDGGSVVNIKNRLAATKQIQVTIYYR